VSPSNNTYFDVLRIVQHLINPHVAAALLSKQLGLKPRRLVRGFVDVPLEAGFKSFTDVMKKFYDEMSDQKSCLKTVFKYSWILLVNKSNNAIIYKIYCSNTIKNL